MVLHPIKAGGSLNDLPVYIPLGDSRSLSFKDTTWKIAAFPICPFYKCFMALLLQPFLELLPCIKQHSMPYTYCLI